MRSSGSCRGQLSGCVMGGGHNHRAGHEQQHLRDVDQHVRKSGWRHRSAPRPPQHPRDAIPSTAWHLPMSSAKHEVVEPRLSCCTAPSTCCGRHGREAGRTTCERQYRRRERPCRHRAASRSGQPPAPTTAASGRARPHPPGARCPETAPEKHRAASFSAVCPPKPWLDAGERPGGRLYARERRRRARPVRGECRGRSRRGSALRHGHPGPRGRLAAPNYAAGAQNGSSDGWIYRAGTACHEGDGASARDV